MLGCAWFTEGDYEFSPGQSVNVDAQLPGFAQTCIRASRPVAPPVGGAFGVGLANQRLLTEAELGALRRARVSAVKVLTSQDSDEMRQLIRQIRGAASEAKIAARLMFSSNGQAFTPAEFWAYCREGALAAYAEGVTDFEAGNEPNLRSEGWGAAWRDGAEFADWWLQLLSILRREMPRAMFGFPGMSPQAASGPDWQDSESFIVQARPALAIADFICSHSYWSGQGSTGWGMRSEDFGGLYWRRLRRAWPGKRFMLTEFSCNNPYVPDADKGAMYAEYKSLLEGVDAAHCFCLSWDGGDPNREGWVRDGRETDIVEALA